MKKYLIDVVSHVSAKIEVEAENKVDAYSVAANQMEESLERQIKNAPANPKVFDLDGYIDVYKTSIRLKK